jgi:hypothetical protein
MASNLRSFSSQTYSSQKTTDKSWNKRTAPKNAAFNSISPTSCLIPITNTNIFEKQSVKENCQIHMNDTK